MGGERLSFSCDIDEDLRICFEFVKLENQDFIYVSPSQSLGFGAMLVTMPVPAQVSEPGVLAGCFEGAARVLLPGYFCRLTGRATC